LGCGRTKTLPIFPVMRKKEFGKSLRPPIYMPSGFRASVGGRIARVNNFTKPAGTWLPPGTLLRLTNTFADQPQTMPG